MNKPRCWVCGRQVGPKFFTPRFQYAIVRDPIGNDHPCHLVCVKDADGKLIRTEHFEAPASQQAAMQAIRPPLADFKPGDRVRWNANGREGVVQQTPSGWRTIVLFEEGPAAIDARTLTRL